jgi:hypothetical protein
MIWLYFSQSEEHLPLFPLLSNRNSQKNFSCACHLLQVMDSTAEIYLTTVQFLFSL